jgi:Lipopolysaccharide kinase (Kdo/WaaP) family/Protein of unknown function (DUF1570)
MLTFPRNRSTSRWEGRRMDRAATLEQTTVSAPLREAPASVPLVDPDLVWTGDAQVVRELLAECDSRFHASLNAARTTVIKSGPHRSVFRVELSSGPVFLKHFKVPDWRALVRNFFNGTPARREAGAAACVVAAGIETTITVAVGSIRRGFLAQDSFLITREIANARPLDQVLREQTGGLGRFPSMSAGGSGRFRRELACSLGKLTGRLHRHHLTHGDLHPANILVDVGPDDSIRLSLIDLQRVRRHRFLQIVSARGDLFGLYNSFNAVAGRSDRRRFFKSYWTELSANPAAGPGQKDLGESSTARKLEARCTRTLRRAQIQNDRKWQRPHRRLIVADRGAQQARGLAVLGQAAILKYCDNPDLLFHETSIRFWRRRSTDCRSAVVNLVVGGTSAACDVREARRRLNWRDFIFGSDSSDTRKAWEMGHALIRRRIDAVRPLLYLRTRTVSCVREFLVTEPSDGMVTLAVYLTHHLPRMAPVEREAWIDRQSVRLAGLLNQLHQYSLVHTQLTAGNILVGVDQNDPRMRIGGVQHVTRKRRITPRDLASEFSQLDSSLGGVDEIGSAHRLRFLKSYLGQRAAGDSVHFWKSLRACLPAITAKPAQTGRAIRTSVGTRIRSRAAVFLATVAVVLSACLGCQTIDRPVGLPVRYSVPGDQLLVLSDFKLPKDHELIRELNGLRQQVTTILELPVKSDPVVVYLFDNETVYRRYMNATYPRLPPRSAYFVGTSTELAVYTHWGQNVREDLRHEYTHGLLHSGLKRVPLWLDEGLAEYFEVAGPKPGGLNHDYAQHLSEAVASGWRPDIKRLENLDDSGQMKRAEYQESWAWVHFLLNSTPEAKQALVDYLGELRTNPRPKTISQRLRTAIPEYDARFVSYISQLRPPATQVGAL